MDALTYGLATLVMREDIFENAMLETKDAKQSTCQSFACKDCGHVNYVHKSKPVMTGRLRRGNYFSQFVKKFSLGVRTFPKTCCTASGLYEQAKAGLEDTDFDSSIILLLAKTSYRQMK